MSRLTLSIDEIAAAPQPVRLWLERKITFVLARRGMPDLRLASAPAREEPVPAPDDAGIRKLIAERAYELWENQRRLLGCDLIHWRQAEQEIMECLRRTPTAPSAAVH